MTRNHVAAAVLILVLLLVLWMCMPVLRAYLRSRREMRRIKADMRQQLARGLTARSYPPFHPEQS